MNIEILSELAPNQTLKPDLVIVGAGPVGLTIARHCAAAGRRVLVVESGLETEDEEHNALTRIENIGELSSPKQIEARVLYHEMVTKLWRQEDQPFGVVCRGLGGSTQAWAGKSAPFDAIDYEQRPWVPLSGWPVGQDEVRNYVDKAMAHLGLNPDPQPNRIDSAGVNSFYWQFARSRTRHTDVLRFGEEFLHDAVEHVDVLLGATVTRVGLRADGTGFDHLDVTSLSGNTARIEAPFCVLAANAIENPRLLLASNDVHPRGIGNAHDNVGRYLMDHPCSTVGTFAAADAGPPAQRFGFFAVTRNRRAYMYLHGLALTPDIQREEGLLNASIFFVPDLAPDDPWEAFKRLIRRESPEFRKDLVRVGSGIGILVRALGLKFVQNRRVPDWLRNFIVNTAMRVIPNVVAEDFVSNGLPHKLTGLRIKAVTEQVPDRESRVTLSENRDALGMPRARIDWRVSDLERTTLLRISELARDAVVAAGMPAPVFADWVNTRRIEDAVIIDMAHSVGTTRMSLDPRFGVVDQDCKVHGLDNLYVSGGSVFPTAGHTNPTLMFVAFAIRLADHLNSRLAASEARPGAGAQSQPSPEAQREPAIAD